ncbi:hypothetical protein CEXT_105871 [Caerostris extrusa]|uniref:Uncharacterized protein n=1 Tax=Caerostris extrusa TaxID=172846 RepID=A0AAV4UMV6_CAEEX|nr:hypothetical protein CEXT_105871 [Caerostris extrusa]
MCCLNSKANKSYIETYRWYRHAKGSQTENELDCMNHQYYILGVSMSKGNYFSYSGFRRKHVSQLVQECLNCVFPVQRIGRDLSIAS